jgi:hypothetical protein
MGTMRPEIVPPDDQDGPAVPKRNESGTRGDSAGLSAVRSKYRTFLGVCHGYAQSRGMEARFSAAVPSHYFDWEPWVRFLQPEFAVIMSADRTDRSRKPVGLILTNTGSWRQIDVMKCHPSEADHLDESEVVSVHELIDQLFDRLPSELGGTKGMEAVKTLKQLQRIVGRGA